MGSTCLDALSNIYIKMLSWFCQFKVDVMIQSTIWPRIRVVETSRIRGAKRSFTHKFKFFRSKFYSILLWLLVSLVKIKVIFFDSKLRLKLAGVLRSFAVTNFDLQASIKGRAIREIGNMMAKIGCKLRNCSHAGFQRENKITGFWVLSTSVLSGFIEV